MNSANGAIFVAKYSSRDGNPEVKYWRCGYVGDDIDSIVPIDSFGHDVQRDLNVLSHLDFSFEYYDVGEVVLAYKSSILDGGPNEWKDDEWEEARILRLDKRRGEVRYGKHIKEGFCYTIEVKFLKCGTEMHLDEMSIKKPPPTRTLPCLEEWFGE